MAERTQEQFLADWLDEMNQLGDVALPAGVQIVGIDQDVRVDEDPSAHATHRGSRGPARPDGILSLES